jgi:hypothetical protein
MKQDKKIYKIFDGQYEDKNLRRRPWFSCHNNSKMDLQ